MTTAASTQDLEASLPLKFHQDSEAGGRTARTISIHAIPGRNEYDRRRRGSGSTYPAAHRDAIRLIPKPTRTPTDHPSLSIPLPDSFRHETRERVTGKYLDRFPEPPGAARELSKPLTASSPLQYSGLISEAHPRTRTSE